MARKKTKKPSMLQRQRQLRAQQQQVKRASSNQLPPGKKGGAVTKPKTAKPKATSKPSPVEKVRVRDLGPTQPKQMRDTPQRALPPGRTGGSLTRSSGGSRAAKAGGVAAKAGSAAGGAGRLLGAFGTALAIPAAIKNITDVAERNKRWEAYKERMGMNQKPNSTNRTGQGSTAGRTTPTAKPEAKPNWRNRTGTADVEQLRQGQNDAIKNHPGNKPKPSAPPKPSGGGSKLPEPTRGSGRPKPSPQGSSSAAKTSSSRNVGPVANGSEYARNKDPKKHNPLMQKTFGYQKGDAPDQRAKRANYSGTNTGVSPKNTGSKNYADKKPANKTTAAYDSGVNLKPASPAKPASPNKPKKKASETLAEALRKRRTQR